MPIVHLFRATRYGPLLGTDLSKLLSPPYDVIDDAERAQLMARHKKNFCASDPRRDRCAGPARRRRARSSSAWLEDTTLLTDPSPWYYLYDVQFRDAERRERTRLGTIALLDVVTARQEGRLLYHERVHDEPVKDRYRLLESIEAHTGQIFLLYSDPAARIEEVTRDYRTRWADQQGRMPDGTVHQLRRAYDMRSIQTITSVLSSATFTIADGHHRTTTALQFAERHPHIPGARFLMVTCVRAEDPGLLVLPTHRFVWGLPATTIQAALARARERFDLHEVPHGLVDPEIRRPGSRLFAYERESGRMYGISPKPGKLADLDAPESLRQEPVVWLHHVLLPLLEIDVAPEPSDRFEYARPQESPTDAAIKSRCDLAFLLPPVSVSAVLRSSQENYILPPKTTFFYPKCMDGLTLYRFADAPKA
ncbi:MAG: DUF1015 domain-containing protein [Planctomycetota bacterium]